MSKAPTYGNTRHGQYGTPAYRSWINMKTRCFNPNSPKYQDYGARGIGVCERWMEFENFYADMGQPPPGMTLERKDVNGHYEPGNCIWADRLTQARNKRSAIVVKGERMPLKEAAAKHGVKETTVHMRLKRGWTLEQALGV